MRNLIDTRRNPKLKAAIIDCLAFIACLVFLVLLLNWGIKNTFAAEVEIGIGHTVYNPSDNGIWWQKGLDHHIETDSNSIQLGVTDYYSDSVRYHAGYMNLGNMSSWALATSDKDFTGSGCYSNPCELNDVFIGHGSVQGLYLTLAPEFTYKSVKFFIEGGLWVYQAKFNMVVIGPDRDGRPVNSVFWNRDKVEYWEVRPVIGLGMEYNKFQAVVSAWGVDSSGENGDTIPNYKGYAVNFTLRKLF